jgi:hypothetical protein
LSSTLIFDHPTLDALATYVECDVLHLGVETGAAGNGSGPDLASSRAEELDQLTDEEVEAILLKKLQTL